MICFSCSKPIEFLEKSQEYLIGKPLESLNVNNAISVRIHGGYGSCKFDMCELIIAICDDCAEKAVEQGRLIVDYDPWVTGENPFDRKK